MGEAAGKFAPGSDAFGLHKLFPLSRQRARHVVESAGELADFVVTLHIDVRFPAARSDITRAVSEFFDRAGDAFGNPPGQEQADQNGGEGHDGGDFEDLAAEKDEFALRAAEKQNAEQFVMTTGERYGMK